MCRHSKKGLSVYVAIRISSTNNGQIVSILAQEYSCPGEILYTQPDKVRQISYPGC